jgi:hypothetical protein
MQTVINRGVTVRMMSFPVIQSQVSLVKTMHPQRKAPV